VEAEIVISKVVTKLTHICKCDDTHPSFEGEIDGNNVHWPLCGRFRMSYCPWCGKHLPHNWPLKEEKKR